MIQKQPVKQAKKWECLGKARLGSREKEESSKSKEN